jgi:hypothetical protein
MSSFVVTGNASGSGTHTLQSANTSSNVTQTLPTADGTTLGYLNTPISSTTTNIAITDVGKVISLSAGITVPSGAGFTAGDIVSLYNNTTGNLTITCSAVTAKLAGSNNTVTSATLATRGVATVLFIDASNIVITGNVS